MFHSAIHYRNSNPNLLRLVTILSLAGLAAYFLTGCGSLGGGTVGGSGQGASAAGTPEGGVQGQDEPALEGETPTPFYDTRPRYAPGELVDYTAQAGDTLPGLAVEIQYQRG